MNQNIGDRLRREFGSTKIRIQMFWCWILKGQIQEKDGKERVYILIIQTYERSTALFGLVLSNVLIINLWTQEIGRFTASNYEIIKIIFEINMRFFNQESVKQLLFVIRDFKRTENLDYIKSIITEDVNKIWNEIKKPKQFENVKPNEFFELSFFPMHNFVYEKEEFNKDAVELSSRFTDKNHKDFYFKSVDVAKNIPFDGLYMFTEKVWDTIKENKELNLPSQKIIVSNFRCSEIKKEVMDQTKIHLDSLKQAVNERGHTSLRKELDDVLQQSLRNFKNNTEQYDDEIVKETENQLRRDSCVQFIEIGNLQKDKIENECVKLMRDKISDLKGITEFLEIVNSLKKLKKDIIDKYVIDMENGTYEEQQALDKMTEKFKDKVENIAGETISTRINNHLRTMQNRKVKEIEVKLNRIFSELNPTFWTEFIYVFNQTFESYTQEINELRSGTEELKNAVDEENFNGIKLDLYFTIKNNVTIKLKSLSHIVIDRFRREFENTPTGMRRNWKVIDENQISEYFNDSKKVCMDILDTANNLSFPSMLTGTI